VTAERLSARELIDTLMTQTGPPPAMPDGAAANDQARRTADMYGRIVETRNERNWLTFGDLARHRLYDALAQSDLSLLLARLVTLAAIVQWWAEDVADRLAAGQTVAMERPDDATLRQVVVDARQAKERAEERKLPKADHLFRPSGSNPGRCKHEVSMGQQTQLCWRPEESHPKPEESKDAGTHT
jgi:hypothetical protein